MCTRPGFGLLIAYFAIVVYSIAVITFVVLLANKNIIDDLVQDEVAKDPNLDGPKLRTVLRGMVAFILGVCLIVVASSGVLARGIIKRRHRYMLPYIVLCCIVIACSLVYTFVILFKLRSPSKKFVIGLSATIIQCVIFYPIYSLYRDVRIENKIIERTGRGA